jgi:hypothetical protein
MIPVNCHRCGRAPYVDKLYAWSVACPNCYDGAPDSGTRNELGDSLDRDEAIEAWNERQEDALEARREIERQAAEFGVIRCEGDSVVYYARKEAP